MAVKVPATAELMVTVQRPSPSVPSVAQLSTTLSGCGAIVTTGFTPETGTMPLPSPASARTVTVKVWAVPTSFTALGSMLMAESTNTLAAGPLPCGPAPIAVTGSVSRAIRTASMDSTMLALATNVPVTCELMVIVHCPAALVPSVAQLSVTSAGRGESWTVGFTPARGCSPLPVSASTVTVKVCD